VQTASLAAALVGVGQREMRLLAGRSLSLSLVVLEPRSSPTMPAAVLWLALAASWPLFARDSAAQSRGTPPSLSRLVPTALLALAALVSWARMRSQNGTVWEPVAIASTIAAQHLVRRRHDIRCRSMRRAPRPPQDGSAVVYRYKIAPVECDEHGRMYGGELLKLMCVPLPLVPTSLRFRG